MSMFFLFLKSAVLDSIKRLSIYGRVISWSNENVKVLTMLLNEKVVSQEEIEQAVHERLINAGRSSWGEVMGGTYPDHTTSPEALGYALRYGVFTKTDERAIRYDHGDTKESFIASSEGMKESIVRQLLTEKPTPPVTEKRTADCCFH